MPKGATKIAISMPPDLARAVERIRKRSGKSRSAIVQDALRHWLTVHDRTELVRDYEAGYRRNPETRREIKAAEAAAVRLLSTDEW
jgi:metal-responsive CopG/Arc/MetJ family transcriptional regulator